LLARFVHTRDEDAFAVLVRRHGGLVLGVCRRLLPDPGVAEDAFQAVWLVLARKAATVRPTDSLPAWLHGVARRVARNALRGEARRRRREAEGLHAAAAPGRPDPLGELTAREALHLLEEELARLPEVYRLPVVLVCLEGLSQEEAAQRLGWTTGSVKGRLERGRRQLHQRLAKRGVSLAIALGIAEEVRGAAAGGVTGLLTARTVKAATHFAAAPAAAGARDASATALAQGVLRAVPLSRVKLVTGAVLALGLLGVGLALLTAPSRVSAPVEQARGAEAWAAGDEAGKLRDSLLALERAGWEALKKPDVEAVAARTADDFVAILADGKRLDRKEFLRELRRAKVKKYELSDARLTTPGKEAAVLTYRARAEYTYRGVAVREDLWVSSTWARRGGKWVGVAYQETPVKE
jgi:RNA polymerase sigma factor (sigma-70 family)